MSRHILNSCLCLLYETLYVAVFNIKVAYPFPRLHSSNLQRWDLWLNSDSWPHVRGMNPKISIISSSQPFLHNSLILVLSPANLKTFHFEKRRQAD